MALAPGSRLGRYEILAPLAAGGMGEVYRARDDRLHRDVAIKVLPASFSSDPDRLRRFEQEAQAAGSLNHPGVLAIYDLGVHDGAPFVVSELLDGETLQDRIAGGPLPSRTALDLARQIAAGLAAAHDKGIVHRDLKPANLFITTDGRIKILDFGLAKFHDRPRRSTIRRPPRQSRPHASASWSAPRATWRPSRPRVGPPITGPISFRSARSCTRCSRAEPVERRDPGPDALPGTADDGVLLTVFTLLNPGQSFSVLSNPGEASRRYDGVQAIGQKRFSDNWQLLAAYTWSTTRGTVDLADGANRAASADTSLTGSFFNPNVRINATGRAHFDYTHQVNLQGSLLLPAWGGVGLSAGYRYLSGGAWGRIATISGLQQGNQSVRVEPRGARRIDGASHLDVRLEKTVSIGSSRTLGIYVDAFNVTNQGVPLAMTVIEASGATLGQPTDWAVPRTVQLAVRLKF